MHQRLTGISIKRTTLVTELLVRSHEPKAHKVSLGYTNQAGVCPYHPSVNTFKLEL